MKRFYLLCVLVLAASVLAAASTASNPSKLRERTAPRTVSASKNNGQARKQALAERISARNEAKLQASGISKPPAKPVLNSKSDLELVVPVGINCQIPLPVPSVPFTDSKNSCGYFDDDHGVSEGCGENAAPDVAYQYTPNRDIRVNINTCGSLFDTKLAVYHEGILVACDDDGYGDDDEYLCENQNMGNSFIRCLPLESGETYCIVVDGWQRATDCGVYTLNIYECAGENCETATVVPSIPYSDEGYTCRADNDYAGEEFEYCFGYRAPDVAYSFTPSEDVYVNITACGSWFDTRLIVLHGDEVLVCNDDGYDDGGNPLCDDQNDGLSSYIPCLFLQGGETYCIVVDGYYDPQDCGDYRLNIFECAPPCDYGPILVDQFPFYDSGNTCGLEDNFSGNEDEDECDNIAPDTLYHFTPSQNVRVDISLCGSSYDTEILVYENGELIACNDDYGYYDDRIGWVGLCEDDNNGLSSRINCLPLFAGVTYCIVIDGYDDSCGEYELSIDLCDEDLPVELASFTASAADNQITLHWSTASESRNDHFDLLRDGETVARVNGAGNSSTVHHYSFTDDRVTNGVAYVYTLVSVDVNGVRETVGQVSSAPNPNASPAITEYALLQNYPNPFNPTTSIRFDLVEFGFVNLKVYNMLGQEVAELVNGELAAGRHAVTFNADNLPSGMYLYKLNAGSFSDVKKMILMK